MRRDGGENPIGPPAAAPSRSQQSAIIHHIAISIASHSQGSTPTSKFQGKLRSLYYTQRRRAAAGMGGGADGDDRMRAGARGAALLLLLGQAAPAAGSSNCSLTPPAARSNFCNGGGCQCWCSPAEGAFTTWQYAPQSFGSFKGGPDTCCYDPTSDPPCYAARPLISNTLGECSRAGGLSSSLRHLAHAKPA